MKPIDYSVYTTMNITRRGPADSVLDVQMKAGANGKQPTAGHAGHEELSEIWRDVGKDDSVRCVVLRGEGLGFSGGGDLALVQDMAQDFEIRSRVWREARDLVYNIINCDKPIVSAMHGPAVGAGLVAGLLAAGGLAQTPPPPAAQTAEQNPLRLGVQLYALGRYDAALTLFERALKENPQDPEALYWLARTQLKLGLVNPALENGKTLVARTPRYLGGYMVLSEAYVALYRQAEDRERGKGYLEQALSVLKDAERVNPRYAPLHLQRGLVYALLGERDKAEASLKQALALEDTPEIRSALAELYLSMGRLDEALAQYAKALEQAPKDLDLRVRYASALLLKGKAEEAETMEEAEAETDRPR